MALKVNIHELRKAPQEIDVELSPDELNLQAEGFDFLKPIRGHVRFQLVSQHILANGYLETIAQTSCGRCLGAMARPIHARVELVFEKRPSLEDMEEQKHLTAEWEADAREIDYYDEDYLDPTDAFRQVTLLELPNYPLCQAACRGLCPKCGADLNKGVCRCDQQEVEVGEPDWKARLKSIKLG